MDLRLPNGLEAEAQRAGGRLQLPADEGQDQGPFTSPRNGGVGEERPQGNKPCTARINITAIGITARKRIRLAIPPVAPIDARFHSHSFSLTPLLLLLLRASVRLAEISLV